MQETGEQRREGQELTHHSFQSHLINGKLNKVLHLIYCSNISGIEANRPTSFETSQIDFFFFPSSPKEKKKGRKKKYIHLGGRGGFFFLLYPENHPRRGIDAMTFFFLFHPVFS